VRFIAHTVKISQDALAVITEPCAGKPSHVLQENSGRLRLSHQAERGRKQVALVIGAQLFARDRKRWAWHPTGKQIDSLVRTAIELLHIARNNVPSSVETEGIGENGLDLYGCRVVKTGPL
jgi:hypothetical protein